MEFTPEQMKKLEEIGRDHGLRFIILHGSCAKGAPRPGSDLDIAILGRRRLSFDEVLKMHGQFSEIFGDNRGRELDLKTLHGVDPLFRYQVTSKSVLLYGDLTDFNEFKAYAFRAYMDGYDLREFQEKLLMKSIGEISKRYAR